MTSPRALRWTRVAALLLAASPACRYDALPRLDDAGPPDAAAPDAAAPDAPPPDAGPPDAGPPDAGPPDAGPPDAAPPDAAVVTLGVAVAPAAVESRVAASRTVTVTVTNAGAVEAEGGVTVTVAGLSVATASELSSTCAAPLAGGASCAVTLALTGVAAGTETATFSAAAAPGGLAAATAEVAVVGACPQACGPTGSSDCCAAALVPGNAVGATLAGDAFARSHDLGSDGAYGDSTFGATVSDVRLDAYEVTVGRFRAFVDAGHGTQARPPAPGAGAHARITGSGWSSAWDPALPTDTAALRAALAGCSTGSLATWTDTPGANDARPVNCVSWYVAMAFCAWDGGYLPTEAEWNYAAAGGVQQRPYPWSSPATSLAISETQASYDPGTLVDPNCRGDGVDYCTVADLVRPGSKPAGDGRWGHADLAGNVGEWTLDHYLFAYPTTTCDDCALLEPSEYRAFRGGGLKSPASGLRTGLRVGGNPTARFDDVGVRCARSP